MFGLGVTELIIVAAIVLLFFGARRLPAIGEGLGKTVREFKKVGKDLRGGAKKEESTDKERPESPNSENSSQLSALKDEIEKIPGVEEVRTVHEKASQVRKWWRVLKH